MKKIILLAIATTLCSCGVNSSDPAVKENLKQSFYNSCVELCQKGIGAGGSDFKNLESCKSDCKKNAEAIAGPAIIPSAK